MTEQPQTQPQTQPSPAETKKKAAAPSPGFTIQPKPKLSKAERRALQEQQRAAKAAGGKAGVGVAKGSKKGSSGDATLQPPPLFPPQPQHLPLQAKLTKLGQDQATATTSLGKVKPTEGASNKEIPGSSASPDVAAASTSKSTAAAAFLVSHLAPYRDPAVLFDTGAVLKHAAAAASSQKNLHPAAVELGYRYATGAVRGGNARCRAMLDCYAVLLRDFAPPPGTADLRHAIEHSVLKPAFTYWTEDCRPHSVSMGNAFSFLKTAVNSLDRDWQWDAVLETVLETVSAYTRERIDYAISAIAETACTKLLHDTGEVVLTYGHSEAVSAVLQRAAASGKQFRVIVVDSKPLQEGRLLLRALLERDVECCYVHLHAVTYVLGQVTKVLVGAAALQSDGSVTGRAGTAVTAMAAHVRNVPVLVCAETHKISNRVQLESITNNELGPTTIPTAPTTTTTTTTSTADESGGVQRLNLLYDLTPAAYVSGIVTELGIVPPSSVAVLLREMNQPQDTKR